MQKLPIPINFGSNKDVEEVLLTDGYQAAAINVYFDQNGNVVRRPGISIYVEIDSSTTEGVVGLFWWPSSSVLLAVCDEDVYRVSSGGVATKISAAGVFEEAGQVSWADFGSTIYAANGGEIIKIQYSSAAAVADGDAPTTVYGVCEMDGYLFAHDGSHVYYSDAGDPDSWSGDFITPSTTIGSIMAIGAKNNILEIVGTSGWEAWRNDGSTPFVKEEQYTVGGGIASRKCFEYIDNTWYFMDNARRPCRLSGRSIEELSPSFSKVVDYYTSTSTTNLYGVKALVDLNPCYIVHIPPVLTEAKKTFIYNIRNGLWTEMAYGDEDYSYIPVICSAWSPSWGRQFLGIKGTGYIGLLTSSAYSDYTDDNTNPIIRTAHVHRDRPDLWKHSYRLDFYLKKTINETSIISPSITVRWRDNGSTTWNTARTITLQALSNTDFTGSIARCGRYRTRQYEITLPTIGSLALVSVMESFVVAGAEDGV